jgi:hypothetical protein
MPRIELPGGHHAELRDPEDLRRGDVRAAMASADRQGVDVGGGMTLNAIGAIEDGLLVRFITSWTLTNAVTGTGNGDGAAPLPVTIESLQDLPLAYFQPLEAAIAPALGQVLREGQQPVDPTQGAPSSRPASSASTPDVRAD